MWLVKPCNKMAFNGVNTHDKIHDTWYGFNLFESGIMGAQKMKRERKRTHTKTAIRIRTKRGQPNIQLYKVLILCVLFVAKNTIAKPSHTIAKHSKSKYAMPHAHARFKCVPWLQYALYTRMYFISPSSSSIIFFSSTFGWHSAIILLTSHLRSRAHTHKKRKHKQQYRRHWIAPMSFDFFSLRSFRVANIFHSTYATSSLICTKFFSAMFSLRRLMIAQ